MTAPSEPCAVAGCWTFALDRRASRPASTTSLPAILVASTPGGDIPTPVGVKYGSD